MVDEMYEVLDMDDVVRHMLLPLQPADKARLEEAYGEEYGVCTHIMVVEQRGDEDGDIPSGVSTWPCTESGMAPFDTPYGSGYDVLQWDDVVRSIMRGEHIV